MLFPQYSDPPPVRPFQDDKPTLLVCWWITIFCTVIILLRVAGRFIRSEKLFIEDKTAALAIIPLLLRMGCVQVILVYGTNNAALADAGLSPEALSHRQTASGLVLLSRILYAATYVYHLALSSFNHFFLITSSFPFLLLLGPGLVSRKRETGSTINLGVPGNGPPHGSATPP